MFHGLVVFLPCKYCHFKGVWVRVPTIVKAFWVILLRLCRVREISFLHLLDGLHYVVGFLVGLLYIIFDVPR
jgi:hypothetical protein